MSQELTLRSSQIRRGNTLVVPVGEGLLYVQPLYLDSDDSLPVLFKVVVSFGDNQVYAADRFEEALRLALLGARGVRGGADAEGNAPDDANLEELVRRAAQEFEAYQAAFGRGDDDEALRRLRNFRRALEAAERLAGGGAAPVPPPVAGADAAPAEPAPAEPATDDEG